MSPVVELFGERCPQCSLDRPASKRHNGYYTWPRPAPPTRRSKRCASKAASTRTPTRSRTRCSPPPTSSTPAIWSRSSTRWCAACASRPARQPERGGVRLLASLLLPGPGALLERGGLGGSGAEEARAAPRAQAEHRSGGLPARGARVGASAELARAGRRVQQRFGRKVHRAQRRAGARSDGKKNGRDRLRRAADRRRPVRGGVRGAAPPRASGHRLWQPLRTGPAAARRAGGLDVARCDLHCRARAGRGSRAACGSAHVSDGIRASVVRVLASMVLRGLGGTSS